MVARAASYHARMNAPNHDGTPRDPFDVFFAPPDPTIGAVRSASTSLNLRNPLVPPRARLLSKIGGGVIGAIVGLFAGAMTFHPIVMLATGPLGIAAGVWLFVKGRTERCSYVGERGFSEHARRFGRVRSRAARFADVVDCNVAQARVRVNGVDMGTRWSFAFVLAGGKTWTQYPMVSRVIASSHAGHPIHFARRARNAWLAARSPALPPDDITDEVLSPPVT